MLDQFLSTRSAQYRGGISSPLSAPTACSRLSAHLAYGTLSLREVVQATRARINALPAVQAAKSQVVEKHASRKRNDTMARKATAKNTASASMRNQLSLDF
ncbi:hypothetical protein [Pusillimonas sp. 7-48]|uniref:Uncharacterized protein n=1 Tax=Pusillimonas minor TaxID=2697024 RepID=A0A842HJQ2_9BURK|nr:hypothetical protein [Pusillimonas minor]